MKFNVNITYDVEAANVEEAQEILEVLSSTPTFAVGSAQLTGFSLHKAYEPVMNDPVPSA